MKYTVIRVLRNLNGECESCTVERSFNNEAEAKSFLSDINRYMASPRLNWVLDSYIVK